MKRTYLFHERTERGHKKEAERGKAAVLFGNEARGLSNEESACERSCLFQPLTPRRDDKEIRHNRGAERKVEKLTTPAPLNLSHAAGIFVRDTRRPVNVNADVGFTSHLLNAEERKRLWINYHWPKKLISLLPSKTYQTAKKTTKRTLC